MIVALLNQKGGVGKNTLALHLAGAWARQGKRITLIDADPQGSALDWSEQRAKEGVPRLFGVIGLARDTLHREAPELARDARHVVIDGPPRITALMRSALLAADLVLIPAQPSPFDGWASGEMLKLIGEAGIFRPQLVARFVLNRCGARTIIARETAELLVGPQPAPLTNAPSPLVRATRIRGSARGKPCLRANRKPASSLRGSPSTSPRNSAAASRSPRSGADRPSPTCCASCSRREFPDQDGDPQ